MRSRWLLVVVVVLAMCGALWVFSSDACGIYGFTNIAFQNSQTVSHNGEIVFIAKKHVTIPEGTGLLLTVVGKTAETNFAVQ
jgi:hypothetical protein